MPLQNALGDIALDSTSQSIRDLQTDIRGLTDTLTVLLAAVLEKMPRVTANDQAAVSIEGGTLPWVTTVTSISGLGSKYSSGDNVNLAGCQHIYSNITVT